MLAQMMPEIDAVFTDIEQCEMKTEWLTSSKLGKVLKRARVLEERKIPLEAKYNSRGRVCALQEKWRDLLGSDEELSHRPKTAAGNNQAKVNASAVESACAEDATIDEPEAEAPETSPPQANDDQNAVNVQSKPIEAEPKTNTNSQDPA
ncbi:hypothetical protein PtB15_8B326 [Puccinia triticina]|nr:hypothetical protein PtB15_8B326 [Puccinia triticina]